MATPLDKIEDGYKFQQIVAEFFRCLKEENHGYKIADIDVEDYGVGGDDGCDILVEFHFEDAIQKHSYKWVVECKSSNKAVGSSDINSNNLNTILQSKNANGYLLVCKNDASASVKRIFNSLNGTNYQYIIWNGSQLWHKLIKSKNLIKAFFPDYYMKYFVEEKVEDTFNELFQKLKNQKLNR